MNSHPNRCKREVDYEDACRHLLWAGQNLPSSGNNKDTWPTNLLDAAGIVLETGGDNEAPVLSADFLGTVEYVLFTALDARERMILKSFYQCGLGLLPIGEQLNVTKERVRQVKAVALHKLGKPPYSDMLCRGIGAYLHDKLEHMSEPIWEGAFQQGYNDGYRDAQMNRPQARLATPVLDTLPLQSEEGLSASTYGFLRRAEKKTVGDIARMSYQELCNLDGFRPKNVGEVIRLLAKYGVFIAPDGNGLTFIQ